jgi:hypothetical protein
MTIKYILSAILIILACSAQGATEECIFDVDEQIQVLKELQNEYPGSKISIGERSLEVAWDKGTIKYQRGGCDHFGETIIYTTTGKADFSTRDAMFAQAIKMGKEFFRGMLSGEKLAELLARKDYQHQRMEGSDWYSIPHEYLIDLSISYSRSGHKQTIDIGYYIN